MPSQGAVAPVPLYRETPLTWLPADKATKLQPAASAEDVGQAEGQLQQWQLTKLQQQAARGRRNVKVRFDISDPDCVFCFRGRFDRARLASSLTALVAGEGSVQQPAALTC